MAGDKTSIIHRLHQQYGNTVLIGPHEVSLNDISNIKDLFSQKGTFPKAPVYESMTLPQLGVSNLRDKAEHSQTRRLLSHAFVSIVL